MEQNIQQETTPTDATDATASAEATTATWGTKVEMHRVTFEPVLRVGTIVHYVLPDYEEGISYWSKGQHRPAMVVRIWDAAMVQLQVFTDGHNDLESGDNVTWRTSVHQDEATKAPGTWHWIEGPDQKVIDEVVHAS